MPAPTTRSQPDQFDKLLSVLAVKERRAIIAHLRDAPTDSASLDGLAAALAPDSPGDREHVRIRLHHNHLPQLAETPLLSYDTATTIVRYHGHPDLRTILNSLPTPETPPLNTET